MANATKGKKQPASTAVSAPPKQLPAAANKVPMGRGFEEADAESFAIPFLALLQNNSPAIDEDDAAYVPGAKEGMFMNTVTHALFDKVLLVPCAYQRRFNRWAPRKAGGGFKGQFMPSQIAGMEAKSTIAQSEEGRWYFPLPDGTYNEHKCDILTDTRMHFCLQLLPNGGTSQVLVSLSRTQLKKSKNWMGQMQDRGGDMFSQVYSAVSKKEENDKGKWRGWIIEHHAEAEEEIVEQAEQFYTAVSKDAVKVKYDTATDAE